MGDRSLAETPELSDDPVNLDHTGEFLDIVGDFTGYLLKLIISLERLPWA